MAVFALELQALRTLGWVEQQLFQVPQIIRRNIDRRRLVTLGCKSHQATMALEEIPLYAVVALPVQPPQLNVAEVAATAHCCAQRSLATSLPEEIHAM